MRKMVVAILLSGMFVAAPAMAAGTASYGQGLAVPDTGTVFSTNAEAPLELAVLSDREMKRTQGEWLAYAARFGIGAAAGGGYYITRYAGSPSWSWWDFGRYSLYSGLGGMFGGNRWAAAALGGATTGFLHRNW